jgi:hypothetical protein
MGEYTTNQTAAIATILSSAVSSSTLLGITLANNYPINEITFFGILTITFWILFPLYLLKKRWSYIIGFLSCSIALTIGAAGILTNIESIWKIYSGTVFNLSLGLILAVNFICAYFSYWSSKEG